MEGKKVITTLEHVLKRAADAWAKFKDKRAMPAKPEHIRHKRQHVTPAVFAEVKHSLKAVGRARGYETVQAVADMHNIGRTTAYKIKGSPTYKHFAGKVTKVEVSQPSRRSHKVAVQVK